MTLLLRVTVTQVMFLTQNAHSVLTIQTEAPHINIDSSQLSILMLIFFEITQLLLEERNIITGTWAHWTKDGPHSLT
jgi:hypothetical protein